MPAGKFYTADYEGEMVSVNTSWRDRNDPNSMTWVEKTIINDDHPGVAHIIGNSTDRKDFNLILLKGQVGGKGGVRSVGQTYGCNYLYKDFTPTFLVCTQKSICAEIADSGYGEENVVYSSIKNILNHPGTFHLYPNIYTANVGNLAMRLACADGHKTVYMLGMTGYSLPEDNIYYEPDHRIYLPAEVEQANNKFTQENVKTFLTYDDVEFFYVCKEKGLMPEAYNWCPNVVEITHLEYIARANLGAIAN